VRVAEELYTWCRACEAGCHLEQRRQGDGLALAEGAHEAGRCTVAQHLQAATTDERRLVVARRRRNGRQERLEGQRVLDELAERLAVIRREYGSQAVALFQGDAHVPDSRAGSKIAAMAGSGALGTVFFDPSEVAGGLECAARWTLGRPAPLRSDLQRARHVLLLGGNQLTTHWGPSHAGRLPAASLERLVAQRGITVADPRTTDLARRAATHVSLRPGTELHLLLGMCHAIVRGRWYDAQFVRDCCAGFDELQAVLEPWTPARAAQVCGIEPAEIMGEALRFARAPMAVAHGSAQAYGTSWSSLTGWAMIVLHALTANLLRPGGCYEHPGAPRGQGMLASMARRLGSALFGPRPSRRRPATQLADAITRGPLRALICLEADPLGSLPGPQALERALRGLDLLVCIDRCETRTTPLAHYLLPAAHFLERPDLDLAHGRPCDLLLRRTPALCQAPPECLPNEAILAQLAHGARLPRSARPARGLSGRLRRALSQADAKRIERWQLELAALRAGLPVGQLRRELGLANESARLLRLGQSDRARWALDTPDGRVALAPEPALRMLRSHQAPRGAASHPLRLITSAYRDCARRPVDRDPQLQEPGVGLHPAAGLAEGQGVRVRTSAGSVEATVRLDKGLRIDTVDLPARWAAAVNHLFDPTQLDPQTGSAWTDGLPCRVEAL